MVKEICDIDEFEKAISSGKVVVVLFTATFCGPCKVIKPVFQKLSKEYSEYLFHMVDVEKGSDIAEKCAIRCMPTFKFFRDGVEIHKELTGAQSSELVRIVSLLSK